LGASALRSCLRNNDEPKVTSKFYHVIPAQAGTQPL